MIHTLHSPPSDAFDLVILSNGPGEVLTWVRPVIAEIHQQLESSQQRHHLRISVILSPCTHASGKEAEILQSWPEVDRVQAPEDFVPFLLRGRTADGWHWHDRGVVVFLGGDQIFPVVIARHLGYRSVLYAEWETQWSGWIDRFAAMNESALKTLPPRHRSKGTIVGDLMADAANLPRDQIDPQELQLLNALSGSIAPIALMPGSKPMKLAPLVPLMIAIADGAIARWRRDFPQRPVLQFVIPVAPTLSLNELAQYADPLYNPAIEQLDWGSATLIPGAFEPRRDRDQPAEILAHLPYLRTSAGNRIYLWSTNPAYSLIDRCQFCLTTVGANTAELGALGVPMFVLLPTHQLDAMRAWDGLLGVLVRLPIVGAWFARLIGWAVWRWLAFRGGSRFAWPNIWAHRQGKAPIVREFLGRFSADEIADELCATIGHPTQLAILRTRLRGVRGQPGAAQAIAEIILEEAARCKS
jgi:lipid-A-disaccharide synthase